MNSVMFAGSCLNFAFEIIKAETTFAYLGAMGHGSHKPTIFKHTIGELAQDQLQGTKKQSLARGVATKNKLTKKTKSGKWWSGNSRMSGSQVWPTELCERIANMVVVLKSR